MDIIHGALPREDSGHILVDGANAQKSYLHNQRWTQTTKVEVRQCKSSLHTVAKVSL